MKSKPEPTRKKSAAPKLPEKAAQGINRGYDHRISTMPRLRRMMVNPSKLADPVLILAPPCSFSWVVCAMLGEHPQMYGLPELHLFGAETVSQWQELCSHESFDMDHGLVRVIAQLFFAEQTERTVELARGWLRRRSHFTTGFLLEALARRVHPLVLVEKSPSIVYRIGFLQRAFRMFPQARFVHLASHPRTYGETVMEAIRGLEKHSALPQSHWLRQLACYPGTAAEISSVSILDPQGGWYELNMNIMEFLKSVPDDQKISVRGEDLLAESGEGLRQLAAWLGLRTDFEAVEAMKHPERSPYACHGPSTTPFGSDIFILHGTLVHSRWIEKHSLEGPLTWREDGQEFSPEVKHLARQLGYA